MQTTWIYNDGGRKAAGYKGDAGDCVARAIAIVTEKPYREVYKELSDRMAKAGHPRSARNGIPKRIYETYMQELGFRWISTMGKGTGIQYHVRPDELPDGKVILRLSGHLTVSIDKVIHDTHDPSRGGTRGIYGFWRI